MSSRQKPPSLLHALASQRRSTSFYWVVATLSIFLVAAGGAMLLLPLFGVGTAFSLEELRDEGFASAAIATGWFLLMTSIVSQLAQEILLHIDEDYYRAHGDQSRRPRDPDVSGKGHREDDIVSG